MPVQRLATLVMSLATFLLLAPRSQADLPPLLLQSDQIARIRATLAGDALIAPAQVEAARQDLRALRAYFGSDLGAERLPGELLGSAFLCLIDSNPSRNPARIARIERAMTEVLESIDDPLELALAANWTRHELKPQVVQDYLRNSQERLAPFEPTDSPSKRRDFRLRLGALALALTFDEHATTEAAWASARTGVLEKARQYFTEAFPTYLALRGPTPTAPVYAAEEEADIFTAMELADALLGGYWKKHGAALSGWLTHYLVATEGLDGLPVLRDRVGGAELGLVPQWRDLIPLRAHLLANRVSDPAAAAVATGIHARLRSDSAPILARPWRWIALAFPVAELPCVDRNRPPLALNLSNAVVFQAPEPGPQIWIETGSPYLRPGQHFDAGHFLVRNRGYMTSSGGADIDSEAIPAKAGEQKLGQRVEPFNFEQYRVSTIAHNCLLFWDETFVEKQNGELFLPVGGQRVESGVLTNFAPLQTRREDSRTRGKLLAFGAERDIAYCALNLTDAYPRRTAAHYTREFVFVAPDRLLIVDRAKPARLGCTPIFVLNLPTLPQVGGESVERQPPLRGLDGRRDAGVWVFNDAAGVSWSVAGGACRLDVLLPAPRKVVVAGGPADRQTIPEGEYRGWQYVPGAADSFERLITPAGRHGAKNAWYRLGKPSSLGPAFEAMPHWGRLEVEPLERQTETVFLHLLTLAAETPALASPPRVIETPTEWSVSWGDDAQSTSITIPRVSLGGQARRPDGSVYHFPEKVEAIAAWSLETR